MTLRRVAQLLIVLFGLILAGFSGWWATRIWSPPYNTVGNFDGDRALQDVQYQISLGPRTSGSTAHDRIVEWMQAELKAAGWQVKIQEATLMGHSIQNVVARRSAQPPRIILAADRGPDPGRRSEPAPGANDGASGVAVLLELARTLPEDSIPVWLVFLDAEDNGELPGWHSSRRHH